MTVGYHINPEQGIVTVTGTGTVDLSEACELGHTILKDASLDPVLPHLVDLRGLSLARTQEQSRTFKQFVLDEYADRIAGSIAIVIDETLDDKSCAALYHLTCSIDKAELFDHYDQALKWLMRREFA